MRVEKKIEMEQPRLAQSSTRPATCSQQGAADSTAPRIPPGRSEGCVECCVLVLGGACGGPRGGPGSALEIKTYHNQNASTTTRTHLSQPKPFIFKHIRIYHNQRRTYHNHNASTATRSGGYVCIYSRKTLIFTLIFNSQPNRRGI